MQVVLIGSGNVASVLGRILLQHGHQIEAVWSRNRSHAALLANELGAGVCTDLTTLPAKAELYLIAVTDDALPEIAAQIRLQDQLVLHVAGSCSRDLLQQVSSRYGVLWPMKMIRKTMQGLGRVTMVIDGNTAEVCSQVQALAREFSPIVTQANDATRLQMHLLAAITANFSNHLYHLAADYAVAHQIDFSLFHPIIEETAHAIQKAHPKDLQAGPAFRGDLQTILQHQSLLRQGSSLEQVYALLTNSIRKQFGK